ncbi:MAG: flagellar filament capping protein FliD [Gallionella sp.]|nr:flagellar filament capping protein FliD [Gallionella sp.]
MMAVNPLGSSGAALDTNAIVEQLMKVERKPLLKIREKETSYQARISAYAILLSSLSTFKSAVTALKDASLTSMKAVVSDSSFFNVTAATPESAGTYNIRVNNLAGSQSVYSPAFAFATSEVADLSVQTAQKLRIQVGGAPAVDIVVNSTNNSLTGIKDAINSANAGIKASVINDGTTHRLILSANATGAANRVVIKVAEDGANYTETGADVDGTGLSRLAFNATYDTDGGVTGGIVQMTQSQAAIDAKLKVDGFEVTRSSNTISDLLSGATLNIFKGDNYLANVQLTLSKDASAYKTKVNAFVTAYNQAVAGIKSMRGDAALRADTTPGAIQAALRSSVSGTYNDKSLAYYGLAHDKTGVLTLDAKKLDEAIAAGESDVTGTLNAMATAMGSVLTAYEKTIIPARQGGYQEALKNVQRSGLNMERKLELTEVALKKKYIALDAQLNRMQGASTYLTQQMEMLSKSFGSK